MKSIILLTVVILSLRGLWIISDSRDNIRSFFSGNLISAGIGLKKVLKSFFSTGTECWNSSCCIRSRWWLDCCHFVGGNMRILIYFRAIKYFRRSWKNLLLIFEIKRIYFVCKNKTVYKITIYIIYCIYLLNKQKLLFIKYITYWVVYLVYKIYILLNK